MSTQSAGHDLTQYDPAEAARQIQADTAWERVQRNLAEEPGGDFTIRNVEILAEPTTGGVRMRGTITFEYYAIDDGFREIRNGGIWRLRDYLTRVGRR